MKNRISHECTAKASTIVKKVEEGWKAHTWSADLLFWIHEDDDSPMRMLRNHPDNLFKVRVFMPSFNKKIYINIQERVHES